jgi:hypothetical protein
MKQLNNEEKNVLLKVAKKKNLTLENEYNYQLFD